MSSNYEKSKEQPLGIVELSAKLKEGMTDREGKLFDIYNQLVDTHDFNAAEEQIITKFATSSKFIHTEGVQDLKSLIDVEPEKFTEDEWQIFLQRLKQGIRRVLELRAKYVAGPYLTNRKSRRAQFAQIVKTSRKRKNLPRLIRASTIPSKFLAIQRQRRDTMRTLGLYNSLPSYVKPKTEIVEVSVAA